jgi:hypothetical protein
VSFKPARCELVGFDWTAPSEQRGVQLRRKIRGIRFLEATPIGCRRLGQVLVGRVDIALEYISD